MEFLSYYLIHLNDTPLQILKYRSLSEDPLNGK